MKNHFYKRMLRGAAIGVCGALLCGGLTACGSAQQGAAGEDTLQIVTTIFPEYDWVNAVLGENPGNAEVTLLTDKGVDFHSYQPSVSDIMKISTCDLFIYVGGESDVWVEDALKEGMNPDRVVLNLLDILGESVKEEEIIEGMQEEPEEEAIESGEIEYDEHVWLSLRNSALLTESIAEALEGMDPKNAPLYRDNTDAYLKELDHLDQSYREAVDSAPKHTLVFGDRFPFLYLAEDYGLDYYAAFSGCSAETEASFETITFLANKVDELSLPAVLTIDGSDQGIARTIVENTKTADQKILMMDSMQSTTEEELAAGESYLSAMERNLEVLKDALK